MAKRYQNLGNRLKKAIESAGFKSLREFSSFSGLSYRSLQEYAKGAQAPGSEALIKLAKVGINPTYILLGEGPPLLKEGVKSPFIKKKFRLKTNNVFVNTTAN